MVFFFRQKPKQFSSVRSQASGGRGQELEVGHHDGARERIGPADAADADRGPEPTRVAAARHRRHPDPGRKDDSGSAEGVHPADAEVLDRTRKAGLGQGPDEAGLVAEGRPVG